MVQKAELKKKKGIKAFLEHLNVIILGGKNEKKV
jgi:hypothetical protein